MNTTIGIIGLGKMGANLARRLLDQRWNVVGYNRTSSVALEMASEGLMPAQSFTELVQKLPSPRVIWLMLPAGSAIDDVLFGENGFANLLEAGDLVIDGGNSHYIDAAPRAERLQEKGIAFLDCGTSGGPSGARNGACLMIGGQRQVFEKCEALFSAIALKNGYQFFEGHGAGHFVKMVHNGIEYGMMQAIAEGFAVMRSSSYRLDLSRVANIYGHGSVIESRLITWMERAFQAHGEEMAGVSGAVAHTGEGAWTVEAAKELGVPVPIIEGSLAFRIASGSNPTYTGQILSALREQFGGHSIQ